MPYRKFAFTAGSYYHLYNRGNNYAVLFLKDENYRYFLRLLTKYFLPGKLEIIAYCLMPNHYHLLVTPLQENLSKIMQPLLLAYTNAFNKRYGRVGALFQGRFRARFVEGNEYLLQLTRYIHLNPVRAKLAKNPQDWEYSSYRDYLGLRKSSLIKPEIVLQHFPSPQDYREFVEEEMEVP